MSDNHSDIPPRDELPDEFEVDCNPYGTWSQESSKPVRDAIVSMAGKTYGALSAQMTFPNYLDAFALAWREFCLKVENTASANGFRSCKDLSEVSPDERVKVALLSLTINGSFVLLGNGCLQYPGASATYERIRLREGRAPKNRRTPRGVICKDEPKVGKPFSFTGGGFVKGTSPIYLLYYTTDHLPEENALRVAREMEDSIHQFKTQVLSHEMTDTVRDVPQKEPERPEPAEEPARAIR